MAASMSAACKGKKRTTALKPIEDGYLTVRERAKLDNTPGLWYSRRPTPGRSRSCSRFPPRALPGVIHPCFYGQERERRPELFSLAPS